MSDNYLVNWIKTDKGNGIKAGDTIIVNCKGADHISGGIYKNNFPVTINQVMGDSILRVSCHLSWPTRYIPMYEVS